MVLDYGGLDMLEQLLESPSRRVRKETLWVLSNISAGSWFQTGALVERSTLLQKVFKLMVDEPREVRGAEQVRMEATWVICNSCMNLDARQILQLVEKGFIGMLERHFTADHTDKAVQIMLQGTKEMLRTLERDSEEDLLAQLYALLIKINFKSKLVALKPHAHRKNLAPVNYLLEFLDAEKESSSRSSKSKSEKGSEEADGDNEEDNDEAVDADMQQEQEDEQEEDVEQ